MKVELSPRFHKDIKKRNVRIQKSFKKAIRLFVKNSHNLELDNHALKDEWEGFRSIDITADYRAVYEEVESGDEIIAYFVTIGTHKELYE